MSLKLFHLVFISLSAILSGGCAYWAIENYRANATSADLVLGVVSAALAIALVLYEVWFLRKTRRIIL